MRWAASSSAATTSGAIRDRAAAIASRPTSTPVTATSTRVEPRRQRRHRRIATRPHVRDDRRDIGRYAGVAFAPRLDQSLEIACKARGVRVKPQRHRFPPAAVRKRSTHGTDVCRAGLEGGAVDDQARAYFGDGFRPRRARSRPVSGRSRRGRRSGRTVRASGPTPLPHSTLRIRPERRGGAKCACVMCGYLVATRT